MTSTDHRVSGEHGAVAAPRSPVAKGSRPTFEVPPVQRKVRPVVFLVVLATLVVLFALALLSPVLAVPLASVVVAVMVAALLGGWRDVAIATPMAFAVGVAIGIEGGLWGTSNLVWRLLLVLMVCAGIAVLTVTRDRSLDEVASSARLLRAVIDAAGVGILVVDADGTIALASSRVEDLVGQPREALHGSELGALIVGGAGLIAPGSDDGFSVDDVLLARHRDGSEVPVRCYSTSWQHDGVTRGTIVVVSWREEIRRADEERRERSMVEHRQRLELVGQLAGGLAHDFNNLLAAASMSIELSLEMLREERRAGSDRVTAAAELSETLDVASTSIERASKLARQLLTLSRRDQASPEPVAIADFLEQLTPLLRASLGSKDAIRCEVTDDAPVALVDANQLEQVLLNLATNSRDAMPDGGTLTINASAVGFGERLRITVTDTGAGMDVATAARAFEPFFSTKTRQAGTGLGLAMVEQIIHRAHGTVEITSTPGSGTTIVIELPAADIVVAQPVVVEVEALWVGGDERQGTILVVDDDFVVARLTARMLHNAGYDVTVAASGREAIEIASSPPRFDLVLSDVVMPDMDGITLCDRLQQMHPTMQALFMSGYTAEYLSDLGPDRSLALLTKPFGRDALLAAVDAAIQRPPPEVQEHDAGV